MLRIASKMDCWYLHHWGWRLVRSTYRIPTAGQVLPYRWQHRQHATMPAAWISAYMAWENDSASSQCNRTAWRRARYQEPKEGGANQSADQRNAWPWLRESWPWQASRQQPNHAGSLSWFDEGKGSKEQHLCDKQTGQEPKHSILRIITGSGTGKKNFRQMHSWIHCFAWDVVR